MLAMNNMTNHLNEKEHHLVLSSNKQRKDFFLQKRDIGIPEFTFSQFFQENLVINYNTPAPLFFRLFFVILFFHNCGPPFL